MKLKEINVDVTGNFSNLETKEEYMFIGKEYHNGSVHYECKRRKRGNKNFRGTVVLCGTGFIYQDTKSVKHNGSFLGCIKEVEGGFIPSNSIVNYHHRYNKVYRTFEGAKNALIDKKYKSKEKASLSLLAQNKFYYTENYLNGLSLTQMAALIDQFMGNMALSIRVVKKFLKSDIIGYYGQGGYKTKTRIVN